MNKKVKLIIAFLTSFIISYLVIGYVKNGMLIGIKWVVFDDCRERAPVPFRDRSVSCISS